MIRAGENKKIYNEELETEEWYTGVKKLKKVRVRNRDDIYVYHYYWMDSYGDLWSDFEAPLANNQRDFDAYRKVEGYMTPNQIKELIDVSGKSLRGFSAYANLGLSTLSQLINNLRVQTPQQENFFKMVSNYMNKNGKLPMLHEPNDLDQLNKKIALDADLVQNMAFQYSIENNMNYDFSLESPKTSISEAA
ncbi:transcriptional regulator [Lactiplantibacillus pingfangensis]|uniref:transcriptional regulator n=1 Tax=Lactiplantibacillus pingfangensis TaxID=2559915 RepID=UPI0010F5FF8E|nr:transcriptional regulator [Lactiplantibacillus pingfangensis]